MQSACGQESAKVTWSLKFWWLRPWAKTWEWNLKVSPHLKELTFGQMSSCLFSFFFFVVACLQLEKIQIRTVQNTNELKNVKLGTTKYNHDHSWRHYSAPYGNLEISSQWATTMPSTYIQHRGKASRDKTFASWQNIKSWRKLFLDCLLLLLPKWPPSQILWRKLPWIGTNLEIRKVLSPESLSLYCTAAYLCLWKHGTTSLKRLVVMNNEE